MAWLDEFAALGDHGIWMLPDGRKLFYPFGFGPNGYLVARPDQAHRIRSRYRWLSAALWLPSVMAVATDDWRCVLGYTVVAAVAQWAVVRLLTRGMSRIRQPLWLLQSWRIRAHHYSRSIIALGVLANIGLIVLGAWATTLGGSIWASLALMAFSFLWVLRWMYIGFVKAN